MIKQIQKQTKLLQELSQNLSQELFNKICTVVELEYLIATSK